MLSIELDVYSGRPNPEWFLSAKQEQDLVDQVLANPKMMLPIDADTGGLGFRGYLVRAVSEDDGAWRQSQLPSQFRLAAGKGEEEAVLLWLLDTSEKPDSSIDDYLREYAQGVLRGDEAGGTQEEEVFEETAGLGPCRRFYSGDQEFSFWNASAVILLNNSYNFAANNRNHTYAQPGRRVGRIYTRLDLFEVRRAAQDDGFNFGCVLGPANVYTALCMAPGPAVRDFHWYRLCANGNWCHKPGRAPARNTDNDGRLISDPRRASRGPYTQFVGYFYGVMPVDVR